MPGLLRGMARTAVVAGTATAVSNRVSRRQANRWAADDQSAYVQQQAPPMAQPTLTASPEPDVDDMFEQLRQLGKLRDQSILTEEEFAAQKARLLAG